MRLYLLLALVSTYLFTAGCSQDIEENATNPSTSPGGGNSNFSSGSPLYFIVETQYDNASDSTRTYQGSCTIDPNNLAANIITCSITVPEGQLRYSDTYISVGTDDAELCPRVEFFPYYRLISDDAGFRRPGDTADIDCSADPTPITCYDGAAVDIVTGFPSFTGVWFSTEGLSESTYRVKPGYENQSFGNTRVCNNLAAGLRGADQDVGGYPTLVANNFQDYVVSCKDSRQETLYQITVTIQDDDSLTGGINDPGFNDFYDWN